MRLLIGLHSLELGGSQINTVDLASELRRRGHDVTLFAVDAGTYTTTIEPVAEAANFKIVRLPGASNLFSQARHVRELADAHHADVLHVYHEDDWLGPVASVASRSRPDRAVVVTNWMMANNSWIPRNATLIVGYPALQREAEQGHRGPVRVLEPPVNTSDDRVDSAAVSAFKRNHGLATDDVLVVMVTRIDLEMKLDSIQLSIKAIEVIDEPGVRLVIVGDGPGMDTVRVASEEANRRLGRSAVVLTGSKSDPRPAYAAADLVLGMGGSALRGMAFGRPVIVMGQGSFSKPFTEETVPYFYDNGFYGSGNDDESGAKLAEKITTLLDPAVRDRLGAFGAEVIRTRYSLDTLTTTLERIYAESTAQPLSFCQRWSDVVFVVLYDIAHRLMPPQLRRAIRSRVRSLRPTTSSKS